MCLVLRETHVSLWLYKTNRLTNAVQTQRLNDDYATIQWCRVYLLNDFTSATVTHKLQNKHTLSHNKAFICATMYHRNTHTSYIHASRGNVMSSWLNVSCEMHLHCVSKKVPIFILSVTSSNINRFSHFLHWWKAYEICYKIHTTLSTSP